MKEKQPILNLTLTDLLTHFGIPISEWGQGSAKSIKDLEEELRLSESSLVIEENGELLRKVKSVGVNVSYRKQGGIYYHLVEDRQDFTDGRTRKRTHMNYSLSEKMKPNEDPQDAARRAVFEEIGLPDTQVIYADTLNETVPSTSYPGIKSAHIIYGFNLRLSRTQYDSKGYIEEGRDKTTHFVWRKTPKTQKK